MKQPEDIALVEAEPRSFHSQSTLSRSNFECTIEDERSQFSEHDQ